MPTTSTRRYTRRTIELAILLSITALVWIGVPRIELNGDDYQYIHSMAPIQSASDAFRPFYSPDCNPSVFRPFTNMTMARDFLAFGWNGNGFHVTNLLLHLIATALVFVFLRRLFGMREFPALLAALFFGILGAHDGNLVTTTGRADVLAAIFTMIALLMEQAHDERPERRLLLRSFALVSYAVALLSKEVAVLALPIIALLYDITPDRLRWSNFWSGIRRAIPYAVVTVLYYLYHRHFTSIPALGSQPLQSEGATSPIALLRNLCYGVGYIFLPVNFRTATVLLTSYRIPLIAAAVVSMVIVIVTAIKTLHRADFKKLYKPLVFTTFTIALVGISFERWRLYAPSIGVIALFFIVGEPVWQKWKNWPGRGMLMGIGLACASLQVIHASEVENDAIAATHLLTSYKNELGALLAPMNPLPSDITVVDIPAKLGSVNVLLLGLEDVTLQGVAEARQLPGAAVGDVSRIKINCNWCTDIYALDRERGFSDFAVTKIGPHDYDIGTPETSTTRFIPDFGNVDRIARRDRSYQDGEQIIEDRGIATLENAEGPMVSKMQILLTDSASIPILFQNGKFELAPW